MNQTRRRHLAAYGGWLAASPLIRAQQLIGEPAGRIAPPEELVNSFEFEAMAQRKLAPELYAEISGSDRRFFDRITLRPRLMMNVSKLDLSVELFGMKLFAPILVGPVAKLGRFHREGEQALVKGAAAAKSAVLLAADSSAQPTAGWIQQIAGDNGPPRGCHAVCATDMDWASVAKLRKRSTVPVLVKGVMGAADAKAALASGADGIVVSNYRGATAPAFASPIEVLPAVVEAVGGKVPILIDGSFRRGSDVLKALAMGARAVLVARPAVWGLAAYGDRGVRLVLELLQTELARDMAMIGAARTSDLQPAMIRIHRW